MEKERNPTVSDDEPKTLEESPFFKKVALPHATDVADPTEISLHLLVKNGGTVVRRLLENVGPYVHEVVAILNDCEDDTEAVIAAYCAERGIPFVPIRVTRETHPELYILDTAKTYQIGRSLGGEEFKGPFTEQPILADWSATRNVGWRACTKPWRLFLDADDIVEDPEAIPGLVKLLEAEKVELAATTYRYSVDEQGRARGQSMRERLAVNKSHIRWVNPIHEILAGTNRVAHVEGNLVVRDVRDNKGKETRIPGRNFKILYHRARSRDWDVTPRILADIIMEVRTVAAWPSMLEFADNVLAKYMEDASWPEERGWILAMVGEMHEGHVHLDKAIDLYKESLEIHPGSKTAFRLSRALFKRACELKDEVEKLDEECRDSPIAESVEELEAKAKVLEGMWRAVISAYELGVANKAVHQVLDDGPLHEEMAKIHVAGALLELGDVEGAKKFSDAAVEAFPESSPIKQMKKQVDKMLASSKAYGKFATPSGSSLVDDVSGVKIPPPASEVAKKVPAERPRDLSPWIVIQSRSVDLDKTAEQLHTINETVKGWDYFPWELHLFLEGGLEEVKSFEGELMELSNGHEPWRVHPTVMGVVQDVGTETWAAGCPWYLIIDSAGDCYQVELINNAGKAISKAGDLVSILKAVRPRKPFPEGSL